MILVGEAGGTKSEWRLIDGDLVKAFSGSAFNALTGNSEQLLSALNIFTDFSKATNVYFYAAGMLPAQIELHRPIFMRFFPAASVHLESDVLGAAKALFQRKPGVVGILGTGSACCAFDGERVSGRVPSLGYILGDEGSGFDLGRRWTRLYLRHQVPADLNALFLRQHPDFQEALVLEWTKDRAVLVSNLAGLTAFLKENEQHPFISHLIETAFLDYFNACVSLMRSIEPWGFIGSVAFHFQERLRASAQKLDIRIEQIIPSAIEGLTHYHQTYG